MIVVEEVVAVTKEKIYVLCVYIGKAFRGRRLWSIKIPFFASCLLTAYFRDSSVSWPPVSHHNVALLSTTTTTHVCVAPPHFHLPPSATLC